MGQSKKRLLQLEVWDRDLFLYECVCLYVCNTVILFCYFASHVCRGQQQSFFNSFWWVGGGKRRCKMKRDIITNPIILLAAKGDDTYYDLKLLFNSNIAQLY